MADRGPLQGKRFFLKGRTTIGRDPGADVTIPGHSASRYHAELRLDESNGSWLLADLASTNGTLVNGEPVSSIQLSDAAQIEIGDCLFLFFEGDRPETGEQRQTLVLSEDAQPGVTSWQPVVDVSALGAGACSQFPSGRLHDLVQIGLILSETGHAEPLADRLVRQLALTFPNAESIALLLDSDEAGYLDIAASASSSGRESPLLSSTIVSYAIDKRQAIIDADVAEDDRFSEAVSLAEHDIASAMCSPVNRGETILGAICAAATTWRTRFTDEDLALLNHVAGQVGLVLQTAQLVEQLEARNSALERAAAQLTASLTGIQLVNAFGSRLGHCRAAAVPQAVAAAIGAPKLDEEREDVSVVFLDLAEFARLVQQLTPEEEHDQVLRRYLSVLIDAIQEDAGQIAETTGDGLLVVVENDDPDAHPAAAIRMANRIREGISGLNQELPGHVAPLQVNMVVNSGPVLLTSIPSQQDAGRPRRLTASGATVTLAVRLAALAQDGQIVVTSETAERAGSEFPLRSLGELRLPPLQERVELLVLSGAENAV